MAHTGDKNGPQEAYTSRVHFCPECTKPLRRIIGKMGPFWGCTGYPGCKVTFNDKDNKPSEEADEHYRCPICTRRMVRTQGDAEDYWYCSGYSKGCSVRLKDDQGRPEAAYRCRGCGSLLAKRQGKTTFWGCTSYPECTRTFADENGRPVF